MGVSHLPAIEAMNVGKSNTPTSSLIDPLNVIKKIKVLSLIFICLCREKTITIQLVKVVAQIRYHKDAFDDILEFRLFFNLQYDVECYV